MTAVFYFCNKCCKSMDTPEIRDFNENWCYDCYSHELSYRNQKCESEKADSDLFLPAFKIAKMMRIEMRQILTILSKFSLRFKIIENENGLKHKIYSVSECITNISRHQKKYPHFFKKK